VNWLMSKLPAIPSSFDPNQRQWLSRLTDFFSGTGWNRVPTLSDLRDAGVLSGDSSGNQLVAGNKVNCGLPTAPEGVVTFAAFETITVKWAPANYPCHDYAEIFALQDSNNILAAERVGVAMGTMFTHVVKGNERWFYWVRFVNKLGDVGPFNAQDGTLGITETDPKYLITALAQDIDESWLANSLNESKNDGSFISTINTLNNQYTLKGDLFGNVYGYGMSSEWNDKLGAWSRFLINSHQFAIRRPKRKVYVYSNNKVYAVGDCIIKPDGTPNTDKTPLMLQCVEAQTQKTTTWPTATRPSILTAKWAVVSPEFRTPSTKYEPGDCVRSTDNKLDTGGQELTDAKAGLMLICVVGGTTSTSVLSDKGAVIGTTFRIKEAEAEVNEVAGKVGETIQDGTVVWAVTSQTPLAVMTDTQIIDGYTYKSGVYIDGAYIVNATIHGAKIKKATIESAHIVDLSANKIAAGELSADYIFVGATPNTKGVVAAGNSYIKINGTTKRMQFNDGTRDRAILATDGLRIYDSTGTPVLLSGSEQGIRNSVNYMPPEYSIFDANYAPSFGTPKNCTALVDAGVGAIGTGALKLVSTAGNAYVHLSPADTEYNVAILAGQKWIVSAYVKSDQASRAGQIQVRRSEKTYVLITDFVTSATAGTWTRVYGTLDMTKTGKDETTLLVRLDNDGHAPGAPCTMYFDAVMLEPQYGGVNTPSTFTPPPNFLINRNFIQVTDELADIASDSKVTPLEKQLIRAEWDVIAVDYATIKNQADAYKISVTNFTKAYNDLWNYLNESSELTPSGVPALITNTSLQLTSNIPINASTFRSRFATYYTENTKVFNQVANVTATTAVWGDGITGRPKSLTDLDKAAGTKLADIEAKATVGATAAQLLSKLDSQTELIVGNTAKSTYLKGLKVGSATLALSEGSYKLGGSGIIINEHGIAGVNGGKSTFAITKDGNATFKGDITGASGTFSGTLDAASGTFGAVTVSTAGSISGGQTAYNTGTGFFLGYSGSAYKFSIGNHLGKYLAWTGSDLVINGDVIGTSNINVDAVSTITSASATELGGAGQPTSISASAKVAAGEKAFWITLVNMNKVGGDGGLFYDMQSGEVIGGPSGTTLTKTITAPSYVSGTASIVITRLKR
jgi:hypothetical protein